MITRPLSTSILSATVLSVCALALSACATSGGAAYGPASGSRDSGYSERFIESDRARITYVADTREAAQSGAMRRAAELAVERGYSHVEVVTRFTGGVDGEPAERRRGGPSVGVGVGTGGLGVGIGLPIGRGKARSGRVQEDLEVILRNDEGEGRRVYRASEILADTSI